MADTELPEILTFDLARQLVARQVGPTFPRRLGTFHVAADGYENETHFRLICGAREYLVDGDEDFMIFDPPVILVEKSTGHVLSLRWEADLEPDIQSMRPISS